ncbi:MAG: outer membrane protein assembly factor BamE [Hydromonas sp.]|jgi:outer membrane protein assembly factor BamE|nr:outer membrane protein assembly factor BamE [Hydromonas sp.]MBP6294804.1 outer membrane protein assembly factor BamE [Hydromonas sp.]
MKQKMTRISLIAAMIFGLSACVNVPYRAPIQQGNVIEEGRAKAIQQGMSKTDVANILGTPILQNLFHKDRWDYIYLLDEQYRDAQQERVSIWFTNGIATKVEHTKVAP